jgi:hypothetical protein
LLHRHFLMLRNSLRLWAKNSARHPIPLVPPPKNRMCAGGLIALENLVRIGMWKSYITKLFTLLKVYAWQTHWSTFTLEIIYLKQNRVKCPKRWTTPIQSVPRDSHEAKNRQRPGSARTRWGRLQRSPRRPSWMGGAGVLTNPPHQPRVRTPCHFRENGPPDFKTWVRLWIEGLIYIL